MYYLALNLIRWFQKKKKIMRCAELSVARGWKVAIDFILAIRIYHCHNLRGYWKVV